MTTVQAPKRVRLPSVTTLTDALIPKGGLPVWVERQTIDAMLTLLRAGELSDRMLPTDVLRALRENNLGANAVRDEAAATGIDVHALLEQYMRTGVLPDVPPGTPPEKYGLYHGAIRWLIARRPEPVAVEQLVCHPERGYAGRFDLRARFQDERLLTVDFKTSHDSQVHSNKHAQVAMYEVAERRCGGQPADGMLVVVFAADGSFREMECPVDAETTVDAALNWHTIHSIFLRACEAANKIEKVARQEPQNRPAPAAKVELVPGDPSTVPGAMKRALRRELPDGGLLEFEEAPAGWTTQAGTRRRADWRAYWYEPPAQGALEVAA